MRCVGEYLSLSLQGIAEFNRQIQRGDSMQYGSASQTEHLNLLVYDMPVAIVEQLTTWIVIDSADTASTSDLFEHVRQSFVLQCRLCYDLRRRYSV
ncbi:hypothetical protein TNCV_3379861 [Trichonephila clavipes]|nr:hypothetical protein TNCV_3379861 [Trichonephila clavipes]